MSRQAIRTGMMVAVLALVGPGSALAQQPVGGLVSVGLGGGVSVPVSDTKSAFDNGFNGTGFVKFNLPAFPIQPRVDLLFQKMDISDVSALESQFAPNTYVGGNQQAFAGLAQGQFDLIKAGPIKPYLVAGLGVSNFKTSLESDSGTSESLSQTEFTVSGGGGLLARLGPVSAYIEGRVNNIVNNGNVVDFNSITTVPVSFGIVF